MIQFILYVKDQKRSCNFYTSVLNTEPELDVPGMTEFLLSPGCKLGLMPEDGIARIINPILPHPKNGNGIPRCELYLLVPDPERSLENALSQGATLVSECSERNWGHLVAYCSDPDGHVVAFAKELN